ncbi:MAG: hypothetical protein HDT42_02695 [Ruminococcaceae bacterium]|nr:hypothetical protein [Oscillospiraceae bacterium]
MFTLDEMIEVKGASATIRGFKELLRGIDTEESLDDPMSEELYIAACELFSKTVKEMLRYKVFLLWSEPDFVSVHVLDTSEECEVWIKDAERLFEENPIPSSNDREMDEFKRNNRFVREISFEQFIELAGAEFDNPDNYSVSETGLEFVFENRTAVVNARAAGEL